jgi:hypothetical protein
MELLLAALAALQDPEPRTPDLRDVRLFVYDASRGLTLRVHKDGKVDVEIVEEGEGRRRVRRYSAPSAEAFLEAHADVARRYGLDRYLSGEEAAGPLRPERPRGPGLRPRPPADWDEEWRRWFEEQEDLFREYRRFFRGPLPAPPRPPRPDLDPGESESRGREFGLRVEGLEDPLRERLGLKPGEGLRVVEVRPGSPAERAGLLKDDILLRVDGRPVADIWQFRRDVRTAMRKSEFELEVLRAGERRTLQAKGEPGGAAY